MFVECPSCTTRCANTVYIYCISIHISWIEYVYINISETVQNIKVYFYNLSLNPRCPQLSIVDTTSSNSTHLCYSMNHTAPPVSIATEVKHQSIVRVDTGHESTEGPFDVKMSPYQYKNLHYLDKMIFKIIFIMGIPIKTVFELKWGPGYSGLNLSLHYYEYFTNTAMACLLIQNAVFTGAGNNLFRVQHQTITWTILMCCWLGPWDPFY